jgi:transcriptional regulator with PAS, ATPase and Fis domain
MNKIPERNKLKTAWSEFTKTGSVKVGVVKDEILKSWMRCKSYGLDPYSDRIETDISEADKQKFQAENSVLIETARPFLDSLFELIKSLEMVVFLTDRNGFILDALGEGNIWEYCKSKNAVPGSSFHEKYSGNNAIALALRLNKPIQMMAEEHYMQMVHVATCAAAPIRDQHGAVIGSLDLTASYETALKHPHTLGMIAAGAQVIENQLRLKYLQAAAETMLTGLVIFDKNNVITHINPAAERILSVSAFTVTNKKLGAVIRTEKILDAILAGEDLSDHELILSESIRKTRCLVSLNPISNLNGERLGSVLFLKELKVIQEMMHKVAGFQAYYRFDDIKGHSKEIKEAIALAKTVSSSPSNVMLAGESGTGKEMLAQAIHSDGAWSSGPFMAINCAAIPNELIESELFGYEAGTFTGGLRGGKSGKFEMANGGTLFLDEVNGMPLSMQAKLLRVLEEKRFQRLGGNTYFHLEARIIAATNKDLREEVDKENFRNDLYYRLNVFEIQVPPLRERVGDIELLALAFTEQINRNLGKKVEGIAPEAIDYLKTYSWPGNVRELKNWIERAVNIAIGPVLAPGDFPSVEQGIEPLDERPSRPDPGRATSLPLGLVERDTILQVLEACGGNMSKTARKLGIGRATLYRKLKKHGLAMTRTVSS